MENRWVAANFMNSPVNALIQSYSRTKARDLASYRRVMESHTNSSNNTLFATADGDIAYFHSNFIPRRDTSFNWTRPVDGSNPATDWRGVLSFDETPNAVNPASGWAYNSNDAPWWAAGAVAGVQHIRNPITLARDVMQRSEHVMLAGPSAWRFAPSSSRKFRGFFEWSRITS